jgi:hypothetical protein
MPGFETQAPESQSPSLDTSHTPVGTIGNDHGVRRRVNRAPASGRRPEFQNTYLHGLAIDLHE